MKNFSEFVKANKDVLYSLAEKNTKYNENGDAVISRDDSWFNENVWDKDCEELVAGENSAARSLVC